MPKVSVIIPTRGKPDLVKRCVDSLLANCPSDDFGVMIIEQGGRESADFVQDRVNTPKVRWMQGKDEWSYSELNNAAARRTQSEFLLLLNNDVFCEHDFLTPLLTTLIRKEIGIVGSKQIFPNGTLQHAGIGLGKGKRPYNIGFAYKNNCQFPSRLVIAVSFASVLVRRSLWKKLKGLDLDYFFNFEDVDFCLRAAEVGSLTYFNAHSTVTHGFSGSREFRNTDKHQADNAFLVFRKKWLENSKLHHLSLRMAGDTRAIA